MKVIQLTIVLLALFFATQTTFAQSDSNNEVDVTVFESVLSTAGWANFKYKDQLALAKKGEYKATSELIKFSGTVDGRAALDHSVTLLELIVSGGDNAFAMAVSMSKPKLKAVLLERLQLAQGRTKKEELRKPMSEWAPMTWAALNNKAYVPVIEPGAAENASKTEAERLRHSKISDLNEPSDAQAPTSDEPKPAKPKKKQ